LFTVSKEIVRFGVVDKFETLPDTPFALVNPTEVTVPTLLPLGKVICKIPFKGFIYSALSVSVENVTFDGCPWQLWTLSSPIRKINKYLMS
jgi:hypothetical protein